MVEYPAAFGLFRARPSKIIHTRMKFSFKLILESLKRQPLFLGTIVCGILGVALRVYHITRNDFVFYDEGFYLNYSRFFGDIMERHPPDTFSQSLSAVWAYLRISLSTGKALWFALVDARMFFGGFKAWSFSREVACLFGVLTIFIVYPFAQRFYSSRRVALLSVAFCALLPSLVFYSRVGLQETLSAFLIVLGFYFYLFPARFGLRTFIAGLIFGAAFFSNYRLIILPGLILVVELWGSFSQRQIPNFRKISLERPFVFLLCFFDWRTR